MNAHESFVKKIIGLQNNLLSFACQLTSSREEARDLLQDTTLKALDNEKKFVDNSNLKGWVFTIMRNIFINNYRHASRTALVFDNTEDLYHLNVAQESSLSTPEGTLTMKEINAAISTFDESYRKPFSMHIAGYKYYEIAEAMHMPIGTVKSRIFLCRRRLQEMLKDFR